MPTHQKLRALGAWIGLSLLGFGCEDTRVVNALCDLPCYTGPQGTAGVGTCKAGRPRCESGVVVECLGEVLPRDELCADMADTDCDGQVGRRLRDAEIGTLCGGGLGACHQGAMNCVEGKLVCLGEGQPEEEDCSGRDMDCDGIVNNIAPALCYDGDLMQLTYPTAECKAGVLACVDGRTKCAGQRLPEAEVCGAGRDANCNGIVDDVDDPTLQNVDVVVALDRSGSMEAYYPSVLPALKHVATEVSRSSWSDRVRFSFIEFPHLEGDSALLLSSGSAEEFAQVVSNVDGYYGSYEVSYNVLYDIETEAYDIQFRRDAARVVWLFADEQGQSDPAEAVDIMHQRLVALYASRRTQLYAFALPDHFDDYADIAAASGGAIYSLRQHTVQVSDLLTGAVTVCAE